MAIRYEVSTLSSKALQANGPISTTRLFNASLSLIDNDGRSRPYLAEALPQLNTATWRVSPDGRMETTYRLRDRGAGVPLSRAPRFGQRRIRGIRQSYDALLERP